MESTEKQALTVGPAMENMLLSLRALENARNYYYMAIDTVFGEKAAAELMEKRGPLFDAVRDMLEKEIAADLRAWANTSPETNEI